MSLESSHPGVIETPQAHDAIEPSTGHGLTVWAERHHSNCPLVAGLGCEQFSRRNSPQSNRAINRPRGHRVAVRYGLSTRDGPLSRSTGDCRLEW